MSPPPPLPAAAAPAGRSAQPVGCLPALVFLLVIACAAAALALKAGLLPKESAGRVVVEIAGAPTGPAMQAHAARIRSAAVLELAARLLNRSKLSAKDREYLAQTLDVEVSGPFLTLTIHARQEGAKDYARALAEAYHEYLVSRNRDERKPDAQASEAYINILEAEAEKARLEWLELMKKSDAFPPEGRDPATEASIKSLAALIGKERTAIVTQEADLALYSEGKPEESKAAGAKDLALRREALARYEKAHEDLRQRAVMQESRRSEIGQVRANFERLTRELDLLKEKTLRERREHSVVLVPLTVVEEAHLVKVPARNLRQGVQLGLFAGVAALAAILLASLTAKCCRRA